MKGLPSIFINAGVNDELFDDGRLFYEKAKLAGVDIQFQAGKEMIHCYPLLATLFPEATKAMNKIVQFIKNHINN